MPPEIRRIIAVEAHRRRSGHCPVRLYSLGTGETFEINPTADGFVDMTSGVSASTAEGRIVLAGPLLVLAVRGRRTSERGRELGRRGECRVVRVHASRQSLGDLLEQPAVAVRIFERG